MGKKQLWIPFENGEMVDYTFGVTHDDDPQNQYEWKPNFVFQARMRLVTWSRGRSAVQVEVQDVIAPAGSDHKIYRMFMKDFFELAQRCKLDGGETEPLDWTFVKRGANYGIKAVLPALPETDEDEP